MAPLHVRSKFCNNLFHMRSKVCIVPFHVLSKVNKFAPHMDWSNADFASHIEGRYADKVAGQVFLLTRIFCDFIIPTIIFCGFFLVGSFALHTSLAGWLPCIQSPIYGPANDSHLGLKSNSSVANFAWTRHYISITGS